MCWSSSSSSSYSSRRCSCIGSYSYHQEDVVPSSPSSCPPSRSSSFLSSSSSSRSTSSSSSSRKNNNRKRNASMLVQSRRRRLVVVVQRPVLLVLVMVMMMVMMMMMSTTTTTVNKNKLMMMMMGGGGGSIIMMVDAGWIDPDTPMDKRTTKSLVDGTTYELVMSDEFNINNRTFQDGHDTIWTALDKSDDDSSNGGGGSMQFYNSSVVTTQDGYLKIYTTLQKTSWDYYDQINKIWHKKQTNYTSGMVQTWNKFCFTGGIIEIDVIFPGTPYIGGLWPAIWMLGNLGRATYEASTNNIWPWSYDTCNRSLQLAQQISACNYENHYGMNPYQGRGATEIDIVEVMAGTSGGPLPSTIPPIELPYGDMTLQIAPGVPGNRPQPGSLPLRESILSANGHTVYAAQTWYENLTMEGNTSINPFFYGTYLGPTKPEEPVTRTKKQAFQADAIGAAHQLTPAHFTKPHTFRLEWQPGEGGRLDWYVKGYKYNDTVYYEGDGNGDDWTHAYSIKDESLSELMGSHIPIEPTYLILNVAVSSTWSFPYDAPGWCPNCYDCDNPECACRFYPGFCSMLRSGKTAMLIDHVRVYQSNNDSAHVGQKHTLGCDPIDYPTADWIYGHEYRYMRNPPFVLQDKHPLKPIQRGGGSCNTDIDCGGGGGGTMNTTTSTTIKNTPNNTNTTNDGTSSTTNSSSSSSSPPQRGRCILHESTKQTRLLMFSTTTYVGNICVCNTGYTGPHCLAIDHVDESIHAHEVRKQQHSLFNTISTIQMPIFMFISILLCFIVLFVVLIIRVIDEKKKRIMLSQQELAAKMYNNNQRRLQRPTFQTTTTTTGPTAQQSGAVADHHHHQDYYQAGAAGSGGVGVGGTTKSMAFRNDNSYNKNYDNDGQPTRGVAGITVVTGTSI